jgi:dienelactone hydrolase
MTEFGLQAHVDHLYAANPRRLAFRAETPDEFAAWQTALRQQVAQLLGIAGRTLPPVQAEKVQAIDRGAYVEEKMALDVGENVPAPVYVLVPKTDPPYKPVVAFHGHNPSEQYFLGNYPDEATAQEMRAVDNNYAQALAEAGYLVCAVAQRGFGERMTDQQLSVEENFWNSCRHLSFEYLMQGRTMLGERVWDGMVALSYVQSRADVVPGVIGCTGNSGGGTTTLWLAALDERITVAVPASYFCSFKHSILGMRHCECNYVPGILQYAEMGDLAALIAPRPLRAIAGERDPIYPIAGTRAQFETVRRAYALLDAEDRCSLAVHPGEHAYNHALSHEWFGRWL